MELSDVESMEVRGSHWSRKCTKNVMDLNLRGADSIRVVAIGVLLYWKVPRPTCALIIPLHPLALSVPCPTSSSGKICVRLDKEINETLPLDVCSWRRGAVAHGVFHFHSVSKADTGHEVQEQSASASHPGLWVLTQSPHRDSRCHSSPGWA